MRRGHGPPPLDNFEWLEGFAPRFGLFEVDYTTLDRRRRPSADLFAALGRGLESDPVEMERIAEA